MRSRCMSACVKLRSYSADIHAFIILVLCLFELRSGQVRIAIFEVRFEQLIQESDMIDDLPKMLDERDVQILSFVMPVYKSSFKPINLPQSFVTPVPTLSHP